MSEAAVTREASLNPADEAWTTGSSDDRLIALRLDAWS